MTELKLKHIRKYQKKKTRIQTEIDVKKNLICTKFKNSNFQICKVVKSHELAVRLTKFDVVSWEEQLFSQTQIFQFSLNFSRCEQTSGRLCLNDKNFHYI